MADAHSISTQLRTALERCDVSRYRVAQETGIHESVLSRFARGKYDLSLANAAKLADWLGLRLTVGAKGKSR